VGIAPPSVNAGLEILSAFVGTWSVGALEVGAGSVVALLDGCAPVLVSVG